MTPYQDYIHLSRYARWRPADERRETWSETTERFIDFFKFRFPQLDWGELHEGIYNMDVLPSMRALMTAGPALERENMSGFNCSFCPVNDWRVFPEILYLLMCGTGVGFSVEKELVHQLPPIPAKFDKGHKIVFGDSKRGWAQGYLDYLNNLLNGWMPTYDLSLIRPEGAPLKTFGGRASGPDPLQKLLEYTKELFINARGRQITTLEAHDLVCVVASCVVVGGVRRSALISLSDLNDDLMRNAKSGTWYTDNVQRTLSNNSAVYNEKPALLPFLHEWETIIQSGSGERGIFNRSAAYRKFESIGRKVVPYVGVNPCVEALLRPYGLCNLSTTVIRPYDTETTISRKIRMAATLGTCQSALTNFRFVRPEFAVNANEERLLGVSMTGIMDNVLTIAAPASILTSWRRVACEVNAQVAKQIGINPSVARTCIKPEGTVSQLTDTSSGIHTRWAPYNIRRVRASKTDPLSQLLLSNGFAAETDITNPSTFVFSFPQKAPATSVTRDQMPALEQLQVWKRYNDFYCDHNPSSTVYVRPEEWLRVGAWVYDNFDSIGGLSFLPYSEHIYQQAPYEEINKETYERLLQEQPMLNIRALREIETTDKTESVQHLACSSSSGCEI